MKTKYFEGCTTTDEVKSEYRRLARQHHPDLGGDTATMQEINAEYAYVMDCFTRGEKPGQTEEKYQSMADVNESIRQAIEKIIALDGITIEICGLWVWVSGNTYAVKSSLKDAGYKFAPKKKEWFFAGVSSSGRGNWTKEDIQEKYGSQVVKQSSWKSAQVN